MGLKKNGSLGLFLMFLQGLVLRVLAGRHGMNVGSILGSNLSDEQTVEQMWVDCGLDLVAIKEEIQNSGSYFSKESVLDSTEISPREDLLAKGTVQEAPSLLSPEVNHTFFNCLISQNFPLDGSRKDSLRSWFVDYLESLRHPARRYLAAQSQDSETDPRSENRVVPQNSSDNSALLVAVALTAAVTSITVALLFLCFFKCQRRTHYPGYSMKDDKPLLSLSLSDYSAGSSHNSFAASNSLLAPPKPLKNDPSQKIEEVSSSNSSSCFESSKSLLAPPKPLKTDSSQNIQVSSLDSSVETPTSHVLAENSWSLSIVLPENFKSSSIVLPENFKSSSIVLPENSSSSSIVLPENSSSSSIVTGNSSYLSDVLPENCNSLTDVLPGNCGSLSSVLPGNSISLSDVLPENSISLSDVLPPENSISTEPKPSSITSETPVLKTSASPPPAAPPPPPCRKPSASAPPPPGPPPPPRGGGPRPPPPPKGAAPRPPNVKFNGAKPGKALPLAPRRPGEESFDGGGAPKTKLKPFFWDKVQARNNQSMVWDRLKAGSFQFNEEMIESLFGYSDKNPAGNKVLSNKDDSPQLVRILEPKKSQNLAISLRAMNAKSEEVCEALMEGNELPPELLHALLKMAPTTEEEMKIRLYGEPSKLGPAEQFIRNIMEVPFAYERIEVLLFMFCLQEEASSTSESFSTIEVACKELRSSRLFFKLLEAVLKTGNRMNDGTYRGGAQAFKLDTLLKLADVRGTDGKTTLLHFVVLEIIRAEGIRAARTLRESQSSFSSINSEDLFDDAPIESGDNYRDLGLNVVSGLSDELENVKKAAGMDADGLAHTVSSLGERLLRTREFLKTKMEKCEEESQFLQSLRGFVAHAEADITSLLEAEKKMRLLVKETTDYFHGNSGKDEGLRLFVIVKEFLGMIDKVCREVKILPKPASKTQRAKETPSPSMSPARDPPAMSPARDPRQLLFPAIKDRRVDFSSSDEDD